MEYQLRRGLLNENGHNDHLNEKIELHRLRKLCRVSNLMPNVIYITMVYRNIVIVGIFIAESL